MKKKYSLVYIIFAFVFAQIAWMGLLGLWIYWYVSNNIIIQQVGDKLSPQITVDSPNLLIFVGGIVLIVCIAVAVFLIFRNLTVQLQLTKLYDNFISNVTHELKSPLASIQLYLETIATKDVPADKRKEFIAIMLKDSLRLKKLIDSILEISRLERKRIAHNYHVYEADQIIRQLINDSIDRFRLPDTSLKIEGSLDCKCVIDRDAMQIVFDNLIDNANKYKTTDLDLVVSLSLNKKHMFIKFSDKGIGIALKDHKKIFHKFQRIDNKNIPNVKGTGLGLYWVKEIMKMHGGRINVLSEGIEMGTTFIVELPIYQTSKRFYINSLLRQTAKKQKLMEEEDGK